MLRSVFALSAGISMLADARPAPAEDIFCTVVGQVQGAFQARLRGSAETKQIRVLFVTEEVSIPIDPVSGRPTGRRVNSPLTIVKELDGFSPEFFEAAVVHETLTSVTCTFYRGGSAERAPHAYFKIKLTNATIVDYKDAGNGMNGEMHGDERERVSFVYDKIDMEDLDSGTGASSDWMAAAPADLQGPG